MLSEQSGTHNALGHPIWPPPASQPQFDGPIRSSIANETRRHTPVRPVYDDFATAHSSITSRSAKSLFRYSPHRSPNRSPRRRSRKRNSLRDRSRPPSRLAHRSVRRPKERSRFDEHLAATVPTNTSQHESLSAFDFDVSQADFKSTRPPQLELSPGRSPGKEYKKQTTSSRLIGSLRKALLNRSSTPTKSPGNLSKSAPQDNIEFGVELKRPEDASRGSYIPKSPAEAEQPGVFVFGGSYQANEPLVQLQYRVADATPAFTIGQGLPGSALDYQNRNKGIEASLHRINEDRYKPVDNASYDGAGYAYVAESHTNSSMREGSTVDNIVKQYAQNDHLWDVKLESDDEHSEDDNVYFDRPTSHPRVHDDVSVHSLLELESVSAGSNVSNHRKRAAAAEFQEQVRAFRLHQSSGQAPKAALPQVPSTVDQRTMHSESEGLDQASSYGDTRNLLEITQRLQALTPGGISSSPKSEAELHSHHSGQAAHGRPNINRNPFRRGPAVAHFTPTLIDGAFDLEGAQKHGVAPRPAVNDSVKKPTLVPQLATERDVSIALHRMSAFSYPTKETSVRHNGDGGFQSSTDSGGLLNYIGKQDRRPQEVVNQEQGFYHESAIHETWIGSNQFEQIRIPINRSGSLSLPATGSRSSVAEDNATDWETVFENGLSRDTPAPLGHVRTAGSSLANNSDEGNISPVFFEHSDFSSTDRIVQHPGRIDYSHDYRKREIKEGNFPILLPSYGPHRVNGFPANSIRSISPFQQQSDTYYYQHPTPLSRDHTNPFRSPPPEVIDGLQVPGATANRPAPVTYGGPRAKQATHSTIVNTGRESGSWMNEYGDPGPTVRPGQALYASTIRAVSGPALPDLQSRSTGSGSNIGDSSSPCPDGLVIDRNSATAQEKVPFSHYTPAGARSSQAAIKERAPLVKGPPGAFYQGLRSRPDYRGRMLTPERQATSKTSRDISRSYPTNQIRPLSLLKARDPEQGIGTFDGQAMRAQLPEDDESRKSTIPPHLGRIKSKTWRLLYTEEQLSRLRDIEGGQGGVHLDSLSQQSFSTTLSSRATGPGPMTAWPSPPRLVPFPHNEFTMRPDTVKTRKNLSNIVLVLCCFFPPMLILYGFGYLDNIVQSWTAGEANTFGRGHKKAALALAAFFFVAVIATIVAVVVKERAS
jgi:hypothetical protein